VPSDASNSWRRHALVGALHFRRLIAHHAVAARDGLEPDVPKMIDDEFH
jgi:hypothetical protein